MGIYWTQFSYPILIGFEHIFLFSRKLKIILTFVKICCNIWIFSVHFILEHFCNSYNQYVLFGRCEQQVKKSYGKDIGNRNYDDVVFLLMRKFLLAHCLSLYTQIYGAKLTVQSKRIEKQTHAEKSIRKTLSSFFSLFRTQPIVYFSCSLRYIFWEKTIRQQNKTHQEVICEKRANISK